MTPDVPFVSVVIPAREAEHVIRRTLASALAQTYGNFEVVVVDDGSVDGTAAAVEAVAAGDARIRLFRRPHSGLPATRNFGISQARGTLIAPLDADDLWHPEKIARQVAKMQSSPAIGLVYCWTVDIDAEDFIIPPVRDKHVAEGRVLADVVANAGVEGSGSTHLIRRSVVEAVGGYDSSLVDGAEDWKLNVALARICEFALVPAHLVGYRRSSGSMSRNVAGMERSMEIVSRWIEEQWPDMPRNIRQQMIYHRNSYLAHQAATNDRLVQALSYQMRAYRARPTALATRASLMFGARVLARVFGVKRSALRSWTKQIAFGDIGIASSREAGSRCDSH